MSTVSSRRERGRRLASARRRAKLTAQQLVEKLAVCTRGEIAVSTSAVYAWESGKNLLSDEIATHLAPIVGTTVDDLVGFTEADPLERIPLGVISQPASRPSTPSASDDEWNVELSLTHPATGEIRRRSWRVVLDRERQEFVIRAQEGSRPDRLRLLIPGETGSQDYVPLRATEDLRDQSAVRVAFNSLQSPPSDRETPAVFIQPTANALPLLWDDLRLAQASEAAAPQRSRIRSISKDLELELSDFLDERHAERLVAFWEESSENGEHLEHYRLHSLPQEVHDPYLRALIETLIFICLLKDHERADSTLNRLEALAGADQSRRRDVHYLSGRRWWYLAKEKDQSLYPRSIDDFAAVLRQLQGSSDDVRRAQCGIYLARIAIEIPKYSDDIYQRTGVTAERLLYDSRLIGRKVGRLDVEFLADRVELIRLSESKDFDSAIFCGRELLRRLEAERLNGFDFRNIEDSVQVSVGIALRRKGTEPDRLIAERIYDKGIDRGRNDSHAGICMYLKGDLYVDRFLEAVGRVSELEAREADISDVSDVVRDRDRSLAEAKRLYDAASEVLKSRGDRLAREKASLRSLWIRGAELPWPTTSQMVRDSHAARESSLTRKLLGSTVTEPTRWIDLSVVDELLQTRHLSIAGDENLASSEDFVGSSAALVIPRRVGDRYMVQIFEPDPTDRRRMRVCGWMVIEGFSDEIWSRLKDIKDQIDQGFAQEEDWNSFRASLRELKASLLEHVEIIRPVALKQVDHLIVLAPDDPFDSFLPIESLMFGSTTHTCLLDHVHKSVVYGGPWGSPLAASSVVIDRGDITVLADTSSLGSQEYWRESPGSTSTILDVVRARTKLATRELPPAGGTIGSRCAVIVAHNDGARTLRQRIDSWQLEDVRAVLLLACGSGALDAISGPFTDGLAQSVRRRLGRDGIVVSNRLPITAAEAFRLLEYVERRVDGRPLAEVVTDYLKERATIGKNPFEHPWFII